MAACAPCGDRTAYLGPSVIYLVLFNERPWTAVFSLIGRGQLWTHFARFGTNFEPTFKFISFLPNYYPKKALLSDPSVALIFGCEANTFKLSALLFRFWYPDHEPLLRLAVSKMN